MSKRVRSLGLAVAALWLTSCSHQRYVQCTITNKSGTEVRTVEVDYPGGSFGTTRIATGSTFGYKFKPLRSGDSKLLYSEGGHDFQINGPKLSQSVGGTMDIVIHPADSSPTVSWNYSPAK